MPDTATNRTALDGLQTRLRAEPAVHAPRVASFLDFLRAHARVPIKSGPDTGSYRPYTFRGREALLEVVRTIDLVIGSTTGTPLKDSTVVLAGGAQFGKTILELFLAAYLTSCRWLNVGTYLPDDGLADGIVDLKFRPDVVDQVGWFAAMTQIGKAVNASGKSVHTKGAFTVTDGKRKASGMFRGLKKIPTTFSMDVVVRDEEDDIPRDKAKYLSGRLTVSDLRLQIIIGTQRVHGAGQNRQWSEGTQGVMLLGPVGSKAKATAEHGSVTQIPARWLNPEDHWPAICRKQLGDEPWVKDPQLTWEGDFRWPDRPDHTAAEYEPDGVYYLADPKTGEPLDRTRPLWIHRKPERIKQRRWSFRVAQFGVDAIDLSQIVAHWKRAVSDGEEMVSFCTDRWAKPKSASQALTPQILERARTVDPYPYADIRPHAARYAGLDTGDRCWLTIIDHAHAGDARIAIGAKLALADVVARVRTLCAKHGVHALFIDERPAVTEARALALELNHLTQARTWPKVDWNSKETYIAMPGGLIWDGRNRTWRNLRCALVQFSKRDAGAGIEQTAHQFQENGQEKFVPLIKVNRYETIDRVVRAFLTPDENVIETYVNAEGAVVTRQQPGLRLPMNPSGSAPILETLDQHLLVGSQREKDEKTGELGDYVDKCENHLLLSTAYAALAGHVAGGRAGRQAAFASARVAVRREIPRRRNLL